MEYFTCEIKFSVETPFDFMRNMEFHRNSMEPRGIDSMGYKTGIAVLQDRQLSATDADSVTT